MRALSFAISVVLVCLIVFTAVNWSVLTASTPLSFVVFDVQGPLGVILLAIMLGLVLLVVAYALMLRTSSLMESRRLNRQLQEQQQLAQQAENSRFTVLQKAIEQEFKSTRAAMDESTNSIIANLGYLDDKLKGNS